MPNGGSVQFQISRQQMICNPRELPVKGNMSIRGDLCLRCCKQILWRFSGGMITDPGNLTPRNCSEIVLSGFPCRQILVNKANAVDANMLQLTRPAVNIHMQSFAIPEVIAGNWTQYKTALNLFLLRPGISPIIPTFSHPGKASSAK